MSSRPLRNTASLKYDKQRAVPGEEQFGGVVGTEHAGIHLPLEEQHGPIEHRPQHGGEVDAEVCAAVERLATHEAHVVGVVGEEVEPRVEHAAPSSGIPPPAR